MNEGEKTVPVTQEELAELEGLASLSLHALAALALFSGLFIASMIWSFVSGTSNLVPVISASNATMLLALILYRRFKLKYRELHELLLRRAQQQEES